MTLPRQHLLLVTSRFPYPPIGGDRLRVFHLARLLACEFDVEVLGLGQASAAELQAFRTATGVRSAQVIAHSRGKALRGAAQALLSGLPLQVGYFRNAALDEAVACSVAQADVMVCHLIRSSEAWRGQRKIPAVLDLCDAISSSYAQVVRTASLLKPWTWVSRIEGPRVQRFEQREIGRFDLLTLVSAADARSLGAPLDRTLLVTQGVELGLFNYVQPDRRQGQALALIGKMDTFPNRNGALWFAREVLPRLPPAMHLKLIGDCPDDLRREFERHARVEVTGRVPDIAAACADCFAAVAPLNVATGIQNKVLEYFAMGLPAVLSASVARGLLPASAGCFVEAESIEQWVAALTGLARSPADANEMAGRARLYVDEHHNWDRIGAALVQRLRQAMLTEVA